MQIVGRLQNNINLENSEVYTSIEMGPRKYTYTQMSRDLPIDFFLLNHFPSTILFRELIKLMTQKMIYLHYFTVKYLIIAFNYEE